MSRLPATTGASYVAKKNWAKRTLKPKRDHGWTCREGFNVFVADRGAVRFDIPRGWHIEPGENGSIKMTDREPPEDNCSIEMTVFYLNDQIEWSGLPIGKMVADVTTHEDEDVLERDGVVEDHRGGMDLAYRRTRFLDPNEMREAYSYTLVARRWNMQPLITVCYWADEAARYGPIWQELLASLVLGDYFEDPTQRLNDD
jgi:hypothetical protein